MMRRFVHLTLMTVIVLGLVPSPPANARRTFTFHGSGNGHGIGMSQWGSYGLAQAGWSYERILRHFYRGTSVTRSRAVPGRVRVGITYDRVVVHLRARSGPVRLWLSAPRTGTLIGRIRNGDTWEVRAAANGYTIRDETGAVVGGRAWGGPGTDMFATYENTGSRVLIPEADDLYGSGHEYNRGYVEFNLYGCPANCRQRLIVPLRFQHYLYGLAEVPATWPVSALRAQAVAARSYAAYVVNRPGSRDYCNCDITDGTIDQVYAAYDREGSANGSRWVDAVADTRGRVVVYNGSIIQAFYASSNGGHSESVENVWHGGDPAYAIPWLRGVCDPGESTRSNPWTDWSKSFSGAELTSRLRPYTGDIGRVTGLSGFERGPSGRVIRVIARGGAGQASISGSSLRSALGLRDTRVWVNANHNILGEIRETYDAAGCRPGLPSKRIVFRNGVYQRFRRGSISHNENARLTVWLRGPIDDEYRAVRGPSGKLGLPTSRVTSRGCRRCGTVVFERGRIYWKDGVGAFALWGGVLDVYLNRRGPSGRLGFPTSRPTKDASGTWSATFQHGSIRCPAGGRCSVSI
jgi:SpoIID/LytB domain protein